jgi:hypothetical protein
MTDDGMIDPSARPSGAGCVECEATGAWWLHLRRCAACGHIGCCDDSLNRHATAHFLATGHAVERSFEPGEDWFWDFVRARYIEGPDLADPQHHPADQPTPGPAGRVPSDWRRQLEEHAARS